MLNLAGKSTMEGTKATETSMKRNKEVEGEESVGREVQKDPKKYISTFLKKPTSFHGIE